MFVAYSDGACRGNPGPAAYAAVIYEDGELVNQAAHYMEHATNNVAEYMGLITAVSLAHSVFAKKVEIRSDSRLAIMQAKGEWRCKDEKLKPLLEGLLQWCGDMEVTWTWVPREENTVADALANTAFP